MMNNPICACLFYLINLGLTLWLIYCGLIILFAVIAITVTFIMNHIGMLIFIGILVFSGTAWVKSKADQPGDSEVK